MLSSYHFITTPFPGQICSLSHQVHMLCQFKFMFFCHCVVSIQVNVLSNKKTHCVRSNQLTVISNWCLVTSKFMQIPVNCTIKSPFHTFITVPGNSILSAIITKTSRQNSLTDLGTNNMHHAPTPCQVPRGRSSTFIIVARPVHLAMSEAGHYKHWDSRQSRLHVGGTFSAFTT